MIRKLNEARWRLTGIQFVQYAAWAVLAGLSFFLVLRVLNLFLPALLASVSSLSNLVIVLPLLGAAVAAIWRWHSLPVVAREVDVRAGTRDRFFTALALSEDSPFRKAVEKEVAAYISRLGLRDHLRLILPGKAMLWLLLPLAGLIVVEKFRQVQDERRAPELAAALQMMEKVQEAAESQQEKSADLEQVVKALELKQAGLSNSAEPLRDALRVLADLEQKLSDSASAEASLASGEKSALAEALAADHPRLAADLRSGDNEAAAQAIAQLDPAALAKALEQAAQHRESKLLQELARQGESARGRLAAMVDSPGAAQGAEGRRKFLSDLKDIRNGVPVASAEAGGGRAGEPGGAPDGEENSAPAQADNAPPGGAPGSEKDLARGSDITAAGETVSQASGGVDEFVEGQQGDGASLVELFRANGNDDAKARQAYRSAYQTALPAALDAVNQEQVPPGSRILVRRYFEAIRPKE